MRRLHRLFMLSGAILSLAATPIGKSHIPQPVLTFHLDFASAVTPVERGTARFAFDAAVEEWEKLVPEQARFKTLPPDTKIGVADFEVIISPEQIDGDDQVLGMYQGSYTKDRTRLHGIIYIISEWGHWRDPEMDIPMDYYDYKWVDMHEIGHLLGLAHHIWDPHGIMDFFDHDKIARRLLVSPTPDEIQTIKDGIDAIGTAVDK